MITVQQEKLSLNEQTIWQILDTITDPEIPVLTVIDLGVIRKVELRPKENTGEMEVIIVLTPTYMGCPAMDMISMNIRLALMEHGFNHVQVKTTYSPAWTTAWMTAAGKEKLKEYGIAPPLDQKSISRIDKLFGTPPEIACPLCNSINTRLISAFGSTACKSLYQCNDCKEPFDYFKCH